MTDPDGLFALVAERAGAGRVIGCRAMNIEGSGALVAGGASGLGEATVRRLHERGAVVTIADVNAEKGEALADELGLRFVACDVREEDQVAGGGRGSGRGRRRPADLGLLRGHRLGAADDRLARARTRSSRSRRSSRST